MTPAAIMFWLSALVVVYVYAGYPVLVFLLARFGGKPVARAPVEPPVLVVIAAYNEADCIEDTVVNKLEQDYPADKLGVIVVSDESTDGTDEIVRGLCSRFPDRVQLVRQQPRAGKTSAINSVMDRLECDIVIFSDANSIYRQDAVRMLVRNFADPAVGYVTGRMVYTSTDGDATSEGCSSYMRYENFIRAQEAAVGSVVGVDGGIDAVRRELYVKMRADQLPDFVLPLNVVTQGARVVYEADAVLREAALSSGSDEYRMRVRVSLRALWALWDMRHLLNVLRYGLFSLQLASHKLLRYLVFVFLMAIAASNLALAGDHGFYRLTLALQAGFYLLAVWGYVMNRAGYRSRAGFLPYYFMLLNVAAGHAFLKFLMRRKQVVWQPRTG